MSCLNLLGKKQFKLKTVISKLTFYCTFHKNPVSPAQQFGTGLIGCSEVCFQRHLTWSRKKDEHLKIRHTQPEILRGGNLRSRTDCRQLRELKNSKLFYIYCSTAIQTKKKHLWCIGAAGLQEREDRILLNIQRSTQLIIVND